MLEVLVIMGVVLLILTFFYKQAVCEFRMNQMEWTQKDKIRPLLQESVPLVIRGIPPLSCWTREDVMTRDCYADLPLFQEMSLVEWMQSATPESGCPWKYAQAQQIARTSGLGVWAAKPSIPLSFRRSSGRGGGHAITVGRGRWGSSGHTRYGLAFFPWMEKLWSASCLKPLSPRFRRTGWAVFPRN